MSMTEMEVLNFIAWKMFYAVVCGFVVGFERRLNSSPAGFKTQILVCTGAMLFTSIPSIAGPLFLPETPRVIAQIVTGVGFLGAGTIIRNNSQGVSGLTTAAWIWFTAAIGILVGIGHGPAALFTTTTLVGVISTTRYVEKRFFARKTPHIELHSDNQVEDIKKAG
jgi:putative Mg2+ transporter-C (MgtC) family protein